MPAIPFAQFTRSILAVYDGPGHATRTRAKMRRTLDLVRGLGVQSTADLTTELVARFVRARAVMVTANTVRGDLSYLSAACRYAAEEGWLDRLPVFRRVRPRASIPARPRCHTIEEIGQVLALLQSRSDTWEGHRLYVLIATIAYTALRRDEALTLRVEDVDLTTGLLTISDRIRRKTVASAASVPIPPELRAVLATWIPVCASRWLFPGVRGRGPWTGGANGARPCDLLRRTGEELGIEGVTLASLRHTWATAARREWGLSDLEVAAVLRHTSPLTQQWYVQAPRGSELVQAVRRVNYRR